MAMSVYGKLKEEYGTFLRAAGRDPDEVRWPFRRSYGIDFPGVKRVETVFVAIGPPTEPGRYFYNPQGTDFLRSKLLALLAAHDEELKDSLNGGPKRSLEVFLKRYYLTDAFKEGMEGASMELLNELLGKEIATLSPRLVVSFGEHALARLRKWIVEEETDFMRLLHLKIDGRTFELIPTYFPR